MQLDGHRKYLVEEFAEDYLEDRLNRRDLLKRVLLITGSVTATASVLTVLGCGANGGMQTAATATSAATSPETAATTAATATTSVAGVTISPDDPAIDAREVRFLGQAGEVLGYLSRPRADGTYPAIIVIHENRGLTEHIRDVTRRYAKENFVALGVDLLSRRGGTGALQENEISGALGQISREEFTSDLQAGIDYLKTQQFVRSGAFGVTGFCFGGGYTWELAINSPDIKAAVPYYGSVSNIEDVRRIQGAVFAVYAGDDPRITGQSSEVEQLLREGGRPVQVKIYPNTGHAFFNDTGQRYNAEAARVVWPETLAWFRQHLSA